MAIWTWGLISSSWSCWPWISTKCWPTAFRTDRLTIWPLIRLTLRPFCRISRRIISSSVSSQPCSSKVSRKALLFSREKSPSISALGAPWRITSVVARLPSIMFIASIIIDLPAPVSPVNTVIPCSKLRDISSIMAKFLIEISNNIGFPTNGEWWLQPLRLLPLSS